jgi:maltooligosyltrehalose trehalohydrolase
VIRVSKSVQKASGATTYPYPSLGALVTDGGVRFQVWAPNFNQVELVWKSGPAQDGTEGSFAEGASSQTMSSAGSEYFEVFVPDIGPGVRYMYRVNGEHLFPDPASRFQPEGVHGPSMVVNPALYKWQDEAWAGIPLERLVFYELHVGTFTPEGTFNGVRQMLTYLRDLGITAIEIMPVADFPGRWNWGYDQAALFAPSRAYGAPDDLRRLVDEAHRVGLAVFQDVIFNHFGPDGAYAPAFGPFFTDKHHTPWGKAMNLDDEGSEHVRAFFIENALHWLTEYHFDGLRLDAAHALVDDSSEHFLAELSEAVGALPGRKRYLIAEDERNERKLLVPRELGGYGLDGAWADDFHHQIRNKIAGDKESYYADFAGTTATDIRKTLRTGWFYTGQHSAFHGRERGTVPEGVPLDRFVICIQNHDQIGNRAQGNRLTADTSPQAYRAASALLLFAPQTPLLFQGQEWGTETPFQFFTDHNEELGRLVSEGRKKEFETFSAFGTDVPDPQDPDTFRRSQLDWDELDEPDHGKTYQFYQDLLRLRPQLGSSFDVEAIGEGGLVLRRGSYCMLVALESGISLPLPEGMHVVLHSEQPKYTESPNPPGIGSNAVHFQAPAVVLLVSTT